MRTWRNVFLKAKWLNYTPKQGFDRPIIQIKATVLLLLYERHIFLMHFTMFISNVFTRLWSILH